MSKAAVVWNSGVNPVHSGLYIVNRDALGQPFRWFNAETETWSRMEYEFELVEVVKDTKSPVGFLPWRGPVAVAAIQPVKAVATANLEVAGEVDHGPSNKVIAKVAKPVKVKVAKDVLADGTVFFREDRQKWVVVVDGKQPAARPTKEGVIKWLAAKFPAIKAVVI